MNRLCVLWLLILLSLMLTSCLDTITEFEDCIPPVTLVSTETTGNIEIVRTNSGWDNFKVKAKDYYVCISASSCTAPEIDIKFTRLPVGTEIKFDGYAANYYMAAVGDALYFGGEIDEKTVWVPYFTIKQLVDPTNNESLKQLGMIDTEGEIVQLNNWQCPNIK